MQVFKVICIDADNKPKRISPYEWITAGTVYTVVEVVKMSLQQNRYGYRLKEVQLSEQSFPYEYYSADRFIALQHLIDVLENSEKVSEPESEEADLELI
jgi:hypothetical protein